MATADCPRRLYKYFAPNRASLLGNALLRYSPLGAFNDPFEGRPEITMLSTDDEALQSIREILPQEASRMYESLAPQVKTVLPFSQLLPLVQQLADAKQTEMLTQFRSLTGLAKTFIHQKFDEHLGALCLSEVPDSLLLTSP